MNNTKKHILIHDSNNNAIKGINKYIISNVNEDYSIIFSKFHGKLLSTIQKYKPAIAMLSSSEYTQEFHDFISEYHTQIKIFLIIYSPINNEQLNNFLDNTNVQIIKNTISSHNYKKTIAEYNNLYDDKLFYDHKLERNNKIVALLSLDNQKNSVLEKITYPNKKYRIVALNNPNFKSPINLGLCNYSDLSYIFNTYDKVIDIDQRFRLEAQASNIPYLSFDLTEESIVNNIENNITVPCVENIETYTYDFFVKQTLLPHLRNA